MNFKVCLSLFAAVCVSLLALPARAETPEEWIKLGARVHGGFGAFIPAGIRIGLDALERLKAEPRGVSVTFYTGEKSPCPCIADGVMLATQASPGQGTLHVAAEKAPAGLLAVVVVRDKKSGAGLRYTIADAWPRSPIGTRISIPPAAIRPPSRHRDCSRSRRRPNRARAENRKEKENQSPGRTATSRPGPYIGPEHVEPIPV